MRIDRFQAWACQTYQQAPEVVSAEPWNDGTTRPAGVEVRIEGMVLRHAITRVRPTGEDLSAPEAPVEGEPPEPVEPRPEPQGPRDPATAAFLASVLAGAAHPEMARVYPYRNDSRHIGLGVECHNGARLHMLLM